jgi:3-dehydroquinate dehydratase II
MQPIHILNGPNLNRLGTREPEIYGTKTLAEIERMCRAVDPALPITFRQTNSEAQLIDWLHEAIDTAGGIIINPAAFSFTSLALLDALKMFPRPIIEVHLSNIHRREPLYHRSLVSLAATAVIAGLGAKGYPTAVRALMELLGGNASEVGGARGRAKRKKLDRVSPRPRKAGHQ